MLITPRERLLDCEKKKLDARYQTRKTVFKVPISSKFLFSHLILYFMQWTSWKRFFDLDKKRFFLWTFKNLKIPFSCGWPVPLITASTCSELWRRFRSVWLQAWLISLVLIYLCKFSFVDHAKFSIPAFCMNYWVKFTEVKQARRVKPEVTCSLIYVTTHSKRREDWCEWWTKMAANLNVLKLLKRLHFIQLEFFFRRSSLGEI